MNSPTVDPLIGTVVDKRYVIERRVARGGMATVYQAIDQRLERPVAIKIMHPHLAEDDEFTRRFIQEARQAARLAHPNIVNVFDQGQEGAITFIVMEYLPGITLRELLNDFGALTPAQTLDIVKAILFGLDAAHQAGIVHRDLKPENVLLADDGRIKIADFGLARAAGNNTATSQALLGTIAYLSPELISRGVADVRSDIYALGIMMFEMLTGKQPYQGDQAVTIAYQHTNDYVSAPSSHNPAIPPEFDEVVSWCTGRSPDERPPHARALLEHVVELEKLLGPETLSQATQALNLTVAMTQRLSPLDVQETEVLNPRDGVFDDLGPTVLIDAEPDPAPEIQRPVATARRKSQMGLWAAVVAIAVLILGGAAAWWLASAGGSVAVPDVSGITVEQATVVLIAAELQVSDSVLEEYDLVLPAGTVKGTNPPAGELVETNSVVRLIVSLGPNSVSVPAVTGKTLSDVTAEFEALNLIVGTTTEEFNDFVDRGTVLRVVSDQGQALPAGSSVLGGSTLNLVVSAGAIPDVTGVSVDDARRALQQVGLTGIVGGDGEFSDTIEEGFVVRILDRDAQIVSPGDTVTLLVSRGPELVAIPNVIDDTISSAKKTLENLGFRVEVRSEIPEEDWSKAFARVTSVDPSVGQEVPAGSLIVLRSFV
jgi:serine/threonine protein kinase/beta-lactam-binding protein with PASTA domain